MTLEQLKDGLYEAEVALNEFLGDEDMQFALVMDTDVDKCVAKAEHALANVEDILRAIERKEKA